MRRRITTGLLASGGFLLLGAGAADAAATDPPNATGECSAEAVIDGGERIDPYASSGVYEIPLSGSAEYSGTVGTGEERDERSFNGSVVIETPPGLPDIELTDQWAWSGPGTGATETGNVNWDLPAALPRGIPLKVVGFHQDAPERCEGHVFVKVEGGLFDSIIGPAAIGGTLLAGVGVAFAGTRSGVPA
ncbi:MAG: hypothetical protein AB8G14_05445 [Ilumatobacter sp.]